MLRVSNLTVAYHHLEVVRQVSADIEAGTIAALVGPNGAGKSTLINAISGLVPLRGGTISFDGEDVGGRAAYEVARLGLIQVPEGRRIYAHLSVRENLALGVRAAKGRKQAATLDRVISLFPVLGERFGQLGGTLSGGQQQMLAIGRALMGEPKMMLLDEPSLGLAPLVVDQVFAALMRLKADGLTLLVVEQNASRALSVASQAFVLENGQLARSGPADEIARDPEIRAHYLGYSNGQNRTI